MSQSTRRNFLKMVPIAALVPVAAEAVQDGVERVKLEPGHYVIFFDPSRIDIEHLCDSQFLLPKGSTGGLCVPVLPSGEAGISDAIKFFKLGEGLDETA